MVPNEAHEHYRALAMAEWKGRMGAEVEGLKDGQAEIFSLLGRMREDLAALKARAAVFGTVGGTLAAALALLAKHFLTAAGGP